MSLKNDYKTGDIFTAQAANEMARGINDNVSNIDMLSGKLAGTRALSSDEKALNRPYLITNLNDINSLNTFVKCGSYHVVFNNIMIGFLHVLGDNMGHCINQILVSNFTTEGITDGIPGAHIDGHVNIMRRVYNINSTKPFAAQGTWSEWEIIAGDDMPAEVIPSPEFSVVDFAGVLDSVTVPLVSISDTALPSSVYFCSDIRSEGVAGSKSGFIYKKGSVYYNNWLNRDEWADNELKPYSNRLYRELRTVLYHIYNPNNEQLEALGGVNTSGVPPFTSLNDALIYAEEASHEGEAITLTSEGKSSMYLVQGGSLLKVITQRDLDEFLGTEIEVTPEFVRLLQDGSPKVITVRTLIDWKVV